MNNSRHVAGQASFIEPEVGTSFDPAGEVVLLQGDCLHHLQGLPGGLATLIITSPPYNLGKVYEKATDLNAYLSALSPILDQLIRVLSPKGSICWQVGNYVEDSEVFPLDIFYYPFFKKHGLRLRNRIIWYFAHGLHASKRFSGRYEVMLWFTKGDSFKFNLDNVRVPSKYPGKRHFKGEKRGMPSGNPLGKNPSDMWQIVQQDWESALWNVPNVKANHPEKTVHPCRFPIELVERCVLALTDEGDWVLDPFSGVGSALLAALRHHRRAIGCEKDEEFLNIARKRIADFYSGALRYRPLGRPVYQPTGREKVSQVPQEWFGGGGNRVKVVGSYSFNNGKEEIAGRYSDLLKEVSEVIETVDANQHNVKQSREKTMPGRMLFDPTSLNRAFKFAFSARAWEPVRIPCEYPTDYYVAGYAAQELNRGAFREMDFVKRTLGVEVQFGKYAFMVYNVCAKMTIFHNLGYIDCGIEVVPVKGFADEMSTGVSYFEQFLWDLEKRGIADIDIPVLILGIDA